MTTTILGAGLAGLSCAYHLGHENCVLFERNSYAGGHIYSHFHDGFTWDEGPHVSFTRDPYVRNLFERSVQGDLLEYEVKVSNYFRGAWIPHPAQSNLFAVPEPYRSDCLEDFLNTRNSTDIKNPPTNYAQWLQYAFGGTFADTFAATYTRKYWACCPEELSIDWIGDRIFYPDVETVVQGSRQAPPTSTHYITKVRYPSRGGYMAFSAALRAEARIHFDHEVSQIDLRKRVVSFTNGKQHTYEKLISTLPLPELIRVAVNVPTHVRDAAQSLSCSTLLLVNVTANHSAKHPYHWFYVYDEDKLSTRINHIELLSRNNVPLGKTGIQVEVYGSRYKPFSDSHSEIAKIIIRELQDMDLIETPESVHTRYIPYANVIFDHQRRASQNIILSWLEQFGLQREFDDLEPMTMWEKVRPQSPGALALAGRFGQWKYYWSDDCVLRGRQLAG